MTRSTRSTLVEIGKSIDLAICGTSVLLASYLLNQPLWKNNVLLLHHPLRELFITGFLGLVWHRSLSATGAYRSYRIFRFSRQVEVLALSSFFAGFWAFFWLRITSLFGAIGTPFLLEESALVCLLTFCGLVGTRAVGRRVTRVLRKRGRNLRNVLIVGSNRRAVALADQLSSKLELGLRPVGFVDDHWHFDDAPEHYKSMHLGGSEKFLPLLRTLAIDEVVIALPIASSYAFSRQIIDWCRQQGIPVRSEGSLFDITGQTASPEELALQFITHHEVVQNPWSLSCKRLLDITVSSVAIILFAPLMIAIAIAVKLTSPGTVLFAQERLKMSKRRFRIWKFRTMVVNAEAMMAQMEHLNQTSGPTFKLANDPRITPVGSFLRKTSLDELPQLFNVFMGDMSLVGPRPLPLRDYDGFSEDWCRRRFSVKPGITCLWQIAGRSSIGFKRWMELDLDYIDHWSVWLDLKILLKTIPVVIRGSGAM